MNSIIQNAELAGLQEHEREIFTIGSAISTLRDSCEKRAVRLARKDAVALQEVIEYSTLISVIEDLRLLNGMIGKEHQAVIKAKAEAEAAGNTGNTMNTGAEAGEIPCQQAYTAVYHGDPVEEPEDRLFARLKAMADEIAADTIMALEAAHPDIWEDRETWKEILLEDARKIENFLQEAGE